MKVFLAIALLAVLLSVVLLGIGTQAMATVARVFARFPLQSSPAPLRWLGISLKNLALVRANKDLPVLLALLPARYHCHRWRDCLRPALLI